MSIRDLAGLTLSAQMHSACSLVGFRPHPEQVNLRTILDSGVARMDGLVAILSTEMRRSPQVGQFRTSCQPLSEPSSRSAVRGGEIKETPSTALYRDGA